MLSPDLIWMFPVLPPALLFVVYVIVGKNIHGDAAL